MSVEKSSSSGTAHAAGRPYASFSYLEPGVDYRSFELSPQIARVAPYVVPLTESQERRAQHLLTDKIAISLHDHTDVSPLHPEDNWDNIREAHIVTGYEGLAASGLDAVFENFLDGTSSITSKMGWKWQDVIHDIGMRYCDWAHQEYVCRAETVEDLRTAHKTGRLAMVPCLEAATPIENEVDRVDVLYGLGIRLMGLVYSESNALGSGCREPADGGLTVLGRRVVDRMNKLGILIDVSHSGDRTSLNIIEASRVPVCISHSGARTLWPITKAKPDETIVACAQRGGVIGIEAAPGTTMVKGEEEHTIDSIMAHFEYCVDLVGIDHVTFGPDTFFGDHAIWYHGENADLLASGYSEYDDVYVEYVKGLENLSEFPNVVRWLVAHDYSDDEIGKAIGGNTIRLLEQVWAR
jgi:membrane dipeptidase